jgi:hypothetical protein
MQPDTYPFRFDIRDKDLVKELVSMEFTIFHPAPDYTTVQAPADLSTSKARKLITLMIAYHKANKDYERARAKCEAIIEKLNIFNGGR